MRKGSAKGVQSEPSASNMGIGMDFGRTRVKTCDVMVQESQVLRGLSIEPYVHSNPQIDKAM